ncbi:MAG: hypothetical protein KJ964_10105 [Verrucomicrobia bacterium]|nr:hypothetical protein [Verrucomicrobiota bacterium]
MMKRLWNDWWIVLAMAILIGVPGLNAAETPPTLGIGNCSNLNPVSADDPVSIALSVKNAGATNGVYTLECEVLDYWFRPARFKQDLTVKAGETAKPVVMLDRQVRGRLFKAQNEVGVNQFQVTAVLKSGDQVLARAEKNFAFQSRIKDYGVLPALAAQEERADDLFGKLRLIDEVKCYDPGDPHPYIEGGRGLDAKYSGSVPQGEWKKIYRETNDCFTRIEPILGQACRVTQGWGWFGYKLNREGLVPGKPYLLVLEYPEDVGRTMSVFNTGNALAQSGDHGFHTGRTLGDHWTRTLNSEYTDYPLSGKYRHWRAFFYLGQEVYSLGDRPGFQYSADSRSNGFWVIIQGVGPDTDALSAGVAVRTISLYEIADVPALFLNVNKPPLELGRREMVETSEYQGSRRFKEGEFGVWAQQLLYQARFFGMTALAPNLPNNDLKRTIIPLLDTINRERLDIKVFPRIMMDRNLFQKIDISKEACVVDARGNREFRNYANNRVGIPDIVHPETLRAIWTLLNHTFSAQFSDPGFSGLMFFKHYGFPFMPSFSDYAMKRFETETGIRAEGTDAAQKRVWLVANKKTEYYQWWYAKEREFLLAIRDRLQTIRPDLKLYYFPWHSDDDHPFSTGRLRFNSLPMLDKIYVPGTSILLVPGFTVPPEKWTPEQKADPYQARIYYVERIAPELAGKVTMEDIVFGRHKDMKKFWGAKRSGELPHLVYPEDMDLVKMLSEPDSIYSAMRVGCNPPLYVNDKGIIYWAPVHYKYTADNAKFLNFFKTGEGVAIGNAFPYNEEPYHANCPKLHAASTIEHAGPFCMMEEILSMAHADPTRIMENMWQPLQRGFPEYARAFAAAYLALPSVPSEVLVDAVEPRDKDIVVRQYRTDYGTYLAVISRAFDLRERNLTVTVKTDPASVAKVQDLVTGKDVAFEKAGAGGIRFAVTTRSMQLLSFLVMPKIPAVVFRDVQPSSAAFSPNGDGRNDQWTVTAQTGAQVPDGPWTARILDAQAHTVREFSGQAPKVHIAWDGKDSAGAICADGRYTLHLASARFPQAVSQREGLIDTTPPQVTMTIAPASSPVNWITLTGQVTGMEASSSLLLVQDNDQPAKRVAVWENGAFQVFIEGLNQGDNIMQFSVEDAEGNRTAPHAVHLQFDLPTAKQMGFDFGAGPIMKDFNAMRNDTSFSEKRGYGWLKYESTWPGDRGKGDDLIRDYCSVKEDSAWAAKLPNGKYKVTVVMVDTVYPHYAPDIYVEGRKVVDNRPIKANDPYRPSFEVELTDGLMNFEFKNPDMKLPYFALNGILIEPKP